MNDSSMISKKWLRNTLVGLIISVISIIAINILVDPYFHFHRPVTRYRLDEERYINDGIARHFDYDAIIIGNSLTQNFKASEFDDIFGTSCIKTPYSGAGYKEIWGALDKDLSYKEHTRLVLVGMDLEDLSKGPEWIRYDYAPDYMYDDNIPNDVNYVLNKTIIYRGTLYNIAKTVLGREDTTFDEYSNWIRQSGPEYACSALSHIDAKEEIYERHLSDDNLMLIRENVQKNILPVVDKYSDTRFIMIIPPSSIAKWASYYCKGEINWRLDGLEYALPMLIDKGNVEIYAFDDEYNITTNLELYCDDIHYEESINSWMLEEIARGNHRVTIDNYKEYIDNVKAFYNAYSYEELNQYID